MRIALSILAAILSLAPSVAGEFDPAVDRILLARKAYDIFVKTGALPQDVEQFTENELWIDVGYLTVDLVDHAISNARHKVLIIGIMSASSDECKRTINISHGLGDLGAGVIQVTAENLATGDFQYFKALDLSTRPSQVQSTCEGDSFALASFFLAPSR